MIGQWDSTFPPLLSSQPADLVVEEKNLFLANPSPLSGISTSESSPRTLGAGPGYKRSPAPAPDLVLEYPVWARPLGLWVSSLCGSLDQGKPWLVYDCLANECKNLTLAGIGSQLPGAFETLAGVVLILLRKLALSPLCQQHPPCDSHPNHCL